MYTMTLQLSGQLQTSEVHGDENNKKQQQIKKTAMEG